MFTERNLKRSAIELGGMAKCVLDTIERSPSEVGTEFLVIRILVSNVDVVDLGSNH